RWPSPDRSCPASEESHMDARLSARRALLALSAAAALLISAPAYAVPLALTHQGRLFAADGKPISSTVEVQFALYDAEDAAAPLWTEIHSITFDDGYFSVSLGEVTPFGNALFDGKARYLGVKVGADPEMTPRAVVQSVPYALMAGDVSGDI